MEVHLKLKMAEDETPTESAEEVVEDTDSKTEDSEEEETE